MEGDAGSGQLNPTPPTSSVDEEQLSEAKQPESSADLASQSEADDLAPQSEAGDLTPPSESVDLASPSEAVDSAELTGEVDANGVLLPTDAEVLPTDAEVLPTDAEDVVVTPEGVVTPVVGSDSRLAGSGWLIGVCVVLLLLTAATTTAGVMALRSHQKSVVAARQDAAALTAAKDCVTATQAPDASAMAASQRKIIECSTGDFGAQAALYSGVLVDAYQAANVQVQVSDMRAAVERHNDDGSINVLVAVRVKVSNTQELNQEQGYRLRVQMAPDAGTYKIARLDQVSR